MFEGLQKELFNLTSLLEHDLTQGSDVLELLVLALEALTAMDDVFFLVRDDLLVLEFEKFLFFLEVVDNLLKTLFEKEDLVLQDLDLLLLLKPTLLILFTLILLQCDTSCLLLVHHDHSLLLSFAEFKYVSLTHGLLCEDLVLVVDSPLNALDVAHGILLSRHLLLGKFFFKLHVHLSLHACLFDLNLVLFLLGCALDYLAVLLPRDNLQLISPHFFVGIAHA